MPTYTPTSLFLLFSLGLAFLFSIGEFFSSPRGEKQIILGWTFFLVGIFLLHAFLITCGSIQNYPGGYLTHLPVSGLMGPFLERYLLLSLGNQRESLKKFFLKMLPALGILLWMLPFYLSNGEEKMALLRNLRTTGLPLFLRIPVLSTMGIMSIFIFSILYRLFLEVRYTVVYKDPRFQTILGVCSFTLFILTYGFVSVLIGSIRGLEGIGFLVGLFLCALYVLRQAYPEFFLEVRKVVEEEKKYRASQLGSLNLEELGKNLRNLFDREKIFLQDDLTLSFLAQKLNLSTHQLSEYLNNELGKNFFQFLNEYRVQEAKSRIELDPNEVLLSIAYSSGFRSKSTFNEVFRKETGFTPSDYRSRMRKKKSK